MRVEPRGRVNKNLLIIFAAIGFCTAANHGLFSADKADPTPAPWELMKQFLNPISKQTELLVEAVGQCDVAKAEAALKAGADPNSLGLDNETQLMMVCQNCNNSEMVRVLLKYGAKPDLHDVGGYTALMTACQGEKPDMVKVLLENGADPNLKAHGDDAKSCGTEGYTALMIACRMSWARTVQVLLAHGADPRIVGADGKTALDIAKEQKQKAIIQILERKPK